MSSVGHWKLTYPPGTPKGIKRSSHRAKVSAVIDGREIELPGVTGLTLATGVNDVDRITLECIGTVEITYAEGVESDDEKVVNQADRDLAEFIRSVRDET